MKKFNVFTLALFLLLSSIGYDAYRVYAATIILTNSSDTVDTFRTNVNTSLTNLNNGLGGATFTATTNYGATVFSTTSPIWFRGAPFSLFASSTAIFNNASTTQLGVSGSAWFTGLTSSNLLMVGSSGLLAGIGTTTLTSSNTLLSISNSPVIIGTSGAVITFPLTKGNFVVGSDASAAQATSTLFASSLGQIGIGTTTPQWPLNIVKAGTPQIALSGTGANIWTLREAGGSLYFATSSPTTFATSSVTNISADSNGKLNVNDVNTGFSGVVSSIRNLTFPIGTSTTWTATTTNGDLRSVVAPFNGTIRSASCLLDAGFLNIDIYHTSTHLPLLLGASSTVGRNIFSSNNTFTSGEAIYFSAGTTTTSVTKSGSCTLQITETP